METAGRPLTWSTGPGGRAGGTRSTGSSVGWTAPVALDATRGRDADDVDATGRGSSRWLGWRLRLLVTCALAGSVALFALVRVLQGLPGLHAGWDLDPQGRIGLSVTDDASLRPYVGRVLKGVLGGSQVVLADDTLLPRPDRRWIVDDAERERRIDVERRLRLALAAPDARLVFDDGSQVQVRLSARSPMGFPLLFWVSIGFAFALYLAATVVLLAHPCVRNIVYAVMTLCQSASLLLVAVDTAVPLGPGEGFVRWVLPSQFALDWITVAAMVNAACLHPRRLPGASAIIATAWGVVGVLAGLAAANRLPHVWWWAQGSIALLGATTIGLFSWSHRIEAHPSAIVLRRFGIVMLSSWVLLTVGVGRFDGFETLHPLVVSGPVVWYLVLASLLLLLPFLARSQDFMREFALLAGISTVATSLDLLFVTVFSLGSFASLALALFASLAAYTSVRQWILNRLLGDSIRTTERVFEQLYRTAREVEAHGERAPALLAQLLGDLFEPLEASVSSDQRSVRARVTGGGSSLRVPVPVLGTTTEPRSSILIRYARRGRRLFTDEDARLADRIVEQLRSAVYFDQAVEQGRSEERSRLAQDLHDDIGARLLTLMYKAPSSEMEDYVRHTLQDLKTLTRGLATGHHRLSHAVGEWKGDIAQRLTAAAIELKWSAAFDDDAMLTVGQWSALTRVLRELVSNAIAHSQADSMQIDFRLERDEVLLRVVDNGCGRDPKAWSHGLGLGGVRKRIKQLGGKVEWREQEPRGIECRVRIRHLSLR